MTNKMTYKRASELLAMIEVDEPDAFIVHSWWGSFVQDYREALQMAIEALEQQPCEDCISRAKAIEKADNLCLETSYDNEKVIEMLNDLPFVAPKEKTGKWIDDEFGSKCSCCGIHTHLDKFDRPMKFEYCSMCGAKMIKSQESEEI